MISLNLERETAAGASFYEQLPRFITDLPAVEDDNYLPSVDRLFEWQGQQFTLEIVPASSVKRAIEGFDYSHRSLFPGKQEELLELTLRRLAISTNINFDEKNFILYFSAAQAVSEYSVVSGSSALTTEELKKSVIIFSDSRYLLKQGETEFFFRPVEGIRIVESGGETYFQVSFASFFFNSERLLTRVFGNLKSA